MIKSSPLVVGWRGMLLLLLRRGDETSMLLYRGTLPMGALLLPGWAGIVSTSLTRGGALPEPRLEGDRSEGPAILEGSAAVLCSAA